MFQQLLKRLPAAMQQDITAYKHRVSADASLLGKTVLQYGFNRIGLDVKLDEIKFTAKDRPFLEGNIDFNISHSGDYIIVAIVQEAGVGVDIEKHRKLDVNLFRRYFDDREWFIIQSAADSMQAFFDFWAIKESAIKCDGRGVEVLMDTHVLIHKTEPPAVAEKVNCAGQLFSYEKIQIDEKYSCSICCDCPFEFHYAEVSIPALVS